MGDNTEPEMTEAHRITQKVQGLVRENMAAMKDGEPGNLIAHGASFLKTAQVERGLFAVLFILLGAWFIYQSNDDTKALREDYDTLQGTAKKLAVQADEQEESLEQMNDTLASLERELREANLVRRATQRSYPNPYREHDSERNR